MDLATVQSVVVRAVEVAMILSLPFLGVSLIAGVLISLLQSVTQIQEQTLSFVPKLLIVLVVFVVMLPWAMEYMSTYMYDLFTMIAEVKP